MNSLSENIETIYDRIARAARRAGREPGDIRLIAVTKTVSVEMIRRAMEAGLRVFGENRVQEAQTKVNSDQLKVKGEKISWHLIGHLQRNKAKYAVRLFELIHSIDSDELAEEINSNAAKINKVQDVLIEVKLSPEETKHGVSPHRLNELSASVGLLKNLNLRGLMTVPPFFADPEDARPFFRELRDLRDRAEAMGFSLPELSMGMSNDFEVAIEEGATMVRVGSAIFGERK